MPNLDFPYDGIIGNDFLSKHNCIINYAEGTLIVDKTKLNVKFTEPVFSICPRSETVIECSVENPKIREGLILDKRISDKVLIANSIVKVKPNERVNVTILNTSEEFITIDPNLKLKLERIPNENINLISNCNNTSQRTEEVLNLLRISHLNGEERYCLYDICSQYSDIFHLPGDKLTCNDSIEHEITTTSSIPINTKSYRFPEIHKQEVQSQINKMLDDGIIKPSTSPWSSPIWIVPKKLDASGQRKWRVVIDYRKLNDMSSIVLDALLN